MLPTRDWLSSQSLGMFFTFWPRHIHMTRTHTHPTHACTALLDLRPPSLVPCIHTYTFAPTLKKHIFTHKFRHNPRPQTVRSPHPPPRSHTEPLRPAPASRDPPVCSGALGWAAWGLLSQPGFLPASPASQSTPARRKGTRSPPHPSAGSRGPPEAAANSAQARPRELGFPRAA